MGDQDWHYSQGKPGLLLQSVLHQIAMNYGHDHTQIASDIKCNLKCNH